MAPQARVIEVRAGGSSSAGPILLILLAVVALGLLFTGNIDRLVAWLGGNRAPAAGIGSGDAGTSSGGDLPKTPSPTPAQPVRAPSGTPYAGKPLP